MTDTNDTGRDHHGYPGDDVDAATEVVVDLAVARALDSPFTAPLPEDFARRVAAAAAAESRQRRRARRSARAAWIGLAAVAFVLVLMAPQLAPAANTVLAPLVRTLGPVVTGPVVGLALVVLPVLWTLDRAFRT